jgi:hypothetical protein
MNMPYDPIYFKVTMPEHTTPQQDMEVQQTVQQIVQETCERGAKAGWDIDLVKELIMGRIKNSVPPGYDIAFVDGPAFGTEATPEQIAEQFKKMLDDSEKTAAIGGEQGMEAVTQVLEKAAVLGAKPRAWTTPIDIVQFGLRALHVVRNAQMLHTARQVLADATEGIGVLDTQLAQRPSPELGVSLINMKIALANALVQHVQAQIMWTEDSAQAISQRMELFVDDGTDKMVVPYGQSQETASPEDSRPGEDITADGWAPTIPEDSPEDDGRETPPAVPFPAEDSRPQDSPLPEGVQEADFREV